MKNNSFKFALAILFLANTTLAGSIELPTHSWVGTISLGPVWNGNCTNQTFYLTPSIEKTYTANNSTNTLGDAELFFGLQKPLTQRLRGQLGLALATTTNAKLSGQIWDDANSQFNNYVYSYQLMHTHAALKGKLLVNGWLISWISASIGVGFNNAHAFSNTPIISEALPNPNFPAHTQTSFTYTLGVGVQKPLNQNWQLGVGYEFADWGNSQLGRALGQTLNHGPTLNHLYTNGVLFNITYVS